MIENTTLKIKKHNIIYIIVLYMLQEFKNF